MNSNRYKLYLAVPALFVALSAYAHEPGEHANEAQALDCSAMGEVDHAEVDASDPIMQAMMMKCQAQLADAALHASQDHNIDKLLGDAVAGADHDHGADVLVGDTHAHEERGHANTAVVGAVAEHNDAHEEEDHGNHGDHH